LKKKDRDKECGRMQRKALLRAGWRRAAEAVRQSIPVRRVAIKKDGMRCRVAAAKICRMYCFVRIELDG
jgi:hypothetical protein